MKRYIFEQRGHLNLTFGLELPPEVDWAGLGAFPEKENLRRRGIKTSVGHQS